MAERVQGWISPSHNSAAILCQAYLTCLYKCARVLILYAADLFSWIQLLFPKGIIFPLPSNALVCQLLCGVYLKIILR